MNPCRLTLGGSSKPALLALFVASTIACTVSVDNNQGPDTPPSDDNAAQPTATVPPTANPTTTATTAPTGESPPKMCTKMGCLSGLAIDIEPAAGGWTKGTYVIDVVADGKKSTCELKLPLPACDKGPATKCEGEAGVKVLERGCGQPASQQTFGPLRFVSAPAEIKVTVKKDGKQLTDSTVKPAYKTVQPNGPDCDPVCQQGKERVCVGKCAEGATPTGELDPFRSRP